MKVVVLGAGLVGGPMAMDLAKDSSFEVTVADLSEDSLGRLKERCPSLSTIVADLSSRENLVSVIQDQDLVLSAVPGFMGFKTLKTILETKRQVVDIAFCPENVLELDKLAKVNGVTAIVDCGVAPGMSNLLTGYAESLMDTSETAMTYVGGLPKIREWPYEYKAVFSPADVIEEYTRPARFVENGNLVVRPALSDPELLEFPEVGTLEAFNSDGLRTMIHTIKAPTRKEKTLRYTGHIEKIAVLRESGFFESTEVDINGTKVRPLDFTSKLLFDKWKLNPGDADITLMRVFVEGSRNGKRLRHRFDLVDHYDEKTKTHSMARTTGYTATMAIRLLAHGLFTETGVIPPEVIGADKNCVDFMIAGLRQRGVIYKESLEEIS